MRVGSGLHPGLPVKGGAQPEEEEEEESEFCWVSLPSPCWASQLEIAPLNSTCHSIAGTKEGKKVLLGPKSAGVSKGVNTISNLHQNPQASGSPQPLNAGTTTNRALLRCPSSSTAPSLGHVCEDSYTPQLRSNATDLLRTGQCLQKVVQWDSSCSLMADY